MTEADDEPYRESALGNSGGWSEARIRRIPEYKRQIVEMTQRGMFLSEISQSLDIAQSTIRRWREQDAEFGQQFEDALSAYMDTVEKEAVRRAVEGIMEPVVSQGRVVMDPQAPGQPLRVRKYSDSLMMFILRGRRRDVYGDKREVDQKTTIDVTGAKDELARKLSAITGSQPAS